MPAVKSLARFFTLTRVISLVILVILSITPLLEAQDKRGYEYPKVLFFIYAVIPSLVLLVFSKGLMKNIVLKSRVFLFAALFILTLVFVSIFRPQFPQNILGSYPYFQGILVYLCCFSFTLLVSALPISFKKYSYTIVASSTVVALVAIWQWVGFHLLHLDVPTYNGRAVGTFGQPNLYSGYLVMIMPLVFFLFEKTRGKLKLLFLIPLLVMVIGVLVSMSRLSIALLLVLVIFVALYYLKKSRHFKKAVLGIGIVSIALGSIFLPPLIQKEIIDPLTGAAYIKNDPDKRIFIWQVALLQGIKEPIIGHGIDSFAQVYRSYFVETARNDSHFGRRDLIVDRAHNYLLDLFVYSGFVGVVLWVLLVEKMFYSMKKQPLLRISLVVYIIFVLFHPQSIMQLIFFWFLAGLSFRQPESLET